MVQSLTTAVGKKTMKGIISFALALVASLIMTGSATAGTEIFKGTGNYESQNLTMTLSNGKTVFSGRSEGVATISTDPPILLNVKCMGLGLMIGDKKNEAKVYCTFRHNDRDGFDLLIYSDAKGGAAKVIGGSGKWRGATGKAHFERTSIQENSGSFSYELTITTP